MTQLVCYKNHKLNFLILK